MDKHDLHFTVIGAGHGGKAMAAHLALMGFPVVLFNRTWENVLQIARQGGIELEHKDGVSGGFGHLTGVTARYDRAVDQADVIMVVTPSSAHRDVALGCAPYLRDGHVVVLNPGRTGGAIEFRKVIRDAGCRADVPIAEASTFVYASRSEGPARACIYCVKNSVPLAALPAAQTAQVLQFVRQAYPQFSDGGNVLRTSFDNMGAIFHPALTMFNAGWIEATGGNYQFYTDGATPSVARILEDLDRERLTVAAALGVRAQSALEWLRVTYGVTGRDIGEAIRNHTGYCGIKAPPSLNHRYLFEDIPMSLVPMAALGRRCGIRVPAMEALIHLAGIMHGTDYWRSGRTLEKLGIAELSIAELTRFVNEGVEPAGLPGWAPVPLRLTPSQDILAVSPGYNAHLPGGGC